MAKWKGQVGNWIMSLESKQRSRVWKEIWELQKHWMAFKVMELNKLPQEEAWLEKRKCLLENH